ncbi:MAG: hypothetical protein H6735_25805 [Alphaproteobacteria bacterium]|nr:hypothetical protein [Alphaproteobacteria bacterium]
MLALLLFAVLTARAEIVDRVVAVVEDQPILQSEVRLEAALARVPSPVPGFRALHDDPLQLAIDQTVIRITAAEISLYQPTREQVADGVSAIRASFEDDQAFATFLEDHGLDEERLATVVRRRMIVDRFLLRNLLAPPSDAAAWATECQALLDTLRPRTRIRTVDLRGNGP